MHFDLRYFREEILNQSQMDFAKVMDKSQNTISRWEREPKNITLDILEEISEKTGYFITDLLNIKNFSKKPWDCDSTKANCIKKAKEEIKHQLDRLKSIRKSVNIKSLNFSNHLDEVTNYYRNNYQKLRKPTIAFLGNSDVGKSTLINTIIGSEIIPTGWTPTTSLSIYVKHMEDKPVHLSDDNTVIISSPIKDKPINIEWLTDGRYFKDSCIETGTISLLEKYGSREGSYYKGNNNKDAEAIIVYIDAPILKLCTLLDLPGFGTSDDINDDLKASEGKRNADIFIYMSLANAFMRGTDITYLKDILDRMQPFENKHNGLEPLCNLFVVASQAHVITKDNELHKILANGAERMNKVLPENYWESRSKYFEFDYDANNLIDRFFTFSRDDLDLSINLKNNILGLLERWPSELCKNTCNEINQTTDQLSKEIDKEIDSLQSFYKNKEMAIDYYNDLAGERDNVYKNSEDFVTKLEEKIELYRKHSILDFKETFDEILNEDSIVSIISKKKFKNRKKDKEEIQNYINNTLKQKMDNICYQYSHKLSDYLNKQLNELNFTAAEGMSNFDYKRAFISTLAGLSTYGALTAYVGTLGNLGGYILVTKAVGLLSSLGISVGGGAVATTAVAAIGGPITIIIGMAVLTGIATSVVTGRNWDSKFSNQIVKLYKENNVKGYYCNILNDWWVDTENAVNKNKIIADYEEQLAEAKEKANYDENEYNNLLVAFKQLKEIL